jgi:hypothetical protein
MSAPAEHERPACKPVCVSTDSSRIDSLQSMAEPDEDMASHEQPALMTLAPPQPVHG